MFISFYFAYQSDFVVLSRTETDFLMPQERQRSRQITVFLFEDEGMKVIEKQQRTESKKTWMRKFKSWFGCKPIVCAIVWSELDCQGILDQAPRAPVKPWHLLMGFYQLKTYSQAGKAADDFKCTEKTYLQWANFFVKSIAGLDKVFVSMFDCFMLFVSASNLF